MSHALIIEDNMIVGHAIQRQLADAGFQSFDHAWTESQAIEYAREHVPDLVVIGDGIEVGSTMAAARAVGGFGTIPILLATSHVGPRDRGGQTMDNELTIQGPCRIDQIEAVVGEIMPSLHQEEMA